MTWLIRLRGIFMMLMPGGVVQWEKRLHYHVMRCNVGICRPRLRVILTVWSSVIDNLN